MEISYGNGGWVRVLDDALPGHLFLRLEDDGRGRWRTADLVLQGGWRHIVGADLRELDLGGIEEIALSRMQAIAARFDTPGPDLRLLMDSFATTFGPGKYAGRHCDACSAPLQGVSPRSVDRWTGDWVSLSFFAQLPDSGVKRPKPAAPDRSTAVVAPKSVPRLQRPTDGLTDEFLQHVSDAYREALFEGLSPAPTLAKQVGDGATDRTIHKWVSVARQRGIMPPARQKGRPSHG